jgi:uncharacterized protein YjiS (DUF1127 family)
MESDMLHDLSRRWTRWIMRRRTIAALGRLDRHMLADIGVPEDRIEEFAEVRVLAEVAAAAEEPRCYPAGAGERFRQIWPAVSGAQAREGNPVLVENV